MKKLFAIILVLAVAVGLVSCTQTPANNTNNIQAMTYAEYCAAAVDAKVVIEGYVQSYALLYGSTRVSMFLQDDDGAYYVYLAVCDAAKAEKLTEGVKVRVTGNKGSYAGESEIQEQSTFEILSGNKIYDPVDVTASLGDEKALESIMNKRVTLKSLVVRESFDKEDRTAASLYKWDGTGKAGDNNDIYFYASGNESSSLFVVESDEHPEGSDVYNTACGLSVGDIIDLEGYMYWYNGPNIHVSNIRTVKTSKADLTKSTGILTHEEYLQTPDGSPVSIEAYVQALSVFDNDTGSFSAFLADADGAYYAENIKADSVVYEQLTEGAKIAVSGYRATENGMPVITEAAVAGILNGYYVHPAANITSYINDDSAVADLAGQKVHIKGITFTGSIGEDFIQTMDPAGKIYTLYMISEELPEDSPVRLAVSSLAPGASIDITCFVFLDPQPQLRIRSISVK